jgi:glucose/arabinose dehydrogenase
MRLSIPVLLSSLGIASSALAMETSLGEVVMQPIITGLDTPWGVAEIPGEGYLVTERDGALLYVRGEDRHVVRGTPKVAASGQGGLLDVTLPRDFAKTRDVFLTYSKPQSGGAGTALAVGKLSKDGKRLTGVRDLFVSVKGGTTGRHYGSRVVEARDGSLFVTIGDRGDRPSAQDRSNHNGAIVRVNRDGSVPRDNPFVGVDGVQPHIWSFGHRNPQGAGLDANGQLWTAEHGAKGGDEVNRIKKGANFGWPVISYGVHYSGKKIGSGAQRNGMEQPAHYWDPSIAPSGLLVYSGEMFPEWKGDMFVGSLKFDHISRLDVKGQSVSEVEVIKSRDMDRVRDIQQASDGAIVFISAGNGAIYKMSR